MIAMLGPRAGEDMRIIIIVIIIKIIISKSTQGFTLPETGQAQNRWRCCDTKTINKAN